MEGGREALGSETCYARPGWPRPHRDLPAFRQLSAGLQAGKHQQPGSLCCFDLLRITGRLPRDSSYKHLLLDQRGPELLSLLSSPGTLSQSLSPSVPHLPIHKMRILATLSEDWWWPCAMPALGSETGDRQSTVTSVTSLES